MGRRFNCIVAMRVVILAAMRWLGIHALTSAINTDQFTLVTLPFGHRLRINPIEQDESGPPAAAAAKIIGSFRTLGRIMAKAGAGTDN